MRVDPLRPYKKELDLAANGSRVNSTASIATARVEVGVLTIIGLAGVALADDTQNANSVIVTVKLRTRGITALNPTSREERSRQLRDAF